MAYVKGQPFKPQFTDPATNTLMSNGTVEFYLTGTSTPTPYYTDSSGTAGGTSLTLDSGGKPSTDVFFDTTITYKLVVKNAAGGVVETLDPFFISDVPSTTTGLTHTVLGLPVNLATFIDRHVGRRFEDFGAVGDGATNDQLAFQSAFDYQQESGCILRGTTGKTYLLATAGQNQVLITNTDIQKPVIVDFEHATIKRGDNTINADFQSLISFRVQDATAVTLDVDIRNLNIDDNFTGQVQSWEHNHALAFTTRLAKGINAKLTNITGTDIIADMIGFGGDGPGTFGDINLTNIEETGRDSGSWLNRSTITLTGIWNTLSIANCPNIDSIQAEVNNSSYQVDERLDTTITNCITLRRLDIDADDTDMPLTMTNVIARKFAVFQSCDADISNSQFYLDQSIRLVGDDANRAGDYRFTGCKFYANSGFTATQNSVIYTTSSKPDGISFENCSFDKDSALALDYYLNIAELLAGSTGAIKNCDFGDIDANSIAVNAGDWDISGNTFEQTTGEAIRLVSASNYDWEGDSNIRIKRNTVKSPSAFLYRMPTGRRSADSGVTYYAVNHWMRGNDVAGGVEQVFYDVNTALIDAINGGTAASGSGPTLAHNKFFSLDTVSDDAAPATGDHIVGQKVEFYTPTAGGHIGTVCTAAGSPGTWKDYGDIAP